MKKKVLILVAVAVLMCLAYLLYPILGIGRAIDKQCDKTIHVAKDAASLEYLVRVANSLAADKQAIDLLKNNNARPLEEKRSLFESVGFDWTVMNVELYAISIWFIEGETADASVGRPAPIRVVRFRAGRSFIDVLVNQEIAAAPPPELQKTKATKINDVVTVYCD